MAKAEVHLSQISSAVLHLQSSCCHASALLVSTVLSGCLLSVVVYCSVVQVEWMGFTSAPAHSDPNKEKPKIISLNVYYYIMCNTLFQYRSTKCFDPNACLSGTISSSVQLSPIHTLRLLWKGWMWENVQNYCLNWIELALEQPGYIIYPECNVE